MFTGIIEELGTVREAQDGKLIINAKKVLWGTNLGDSIAVNGVDLTCAYLEEDGFHAHVMPETYRRTNLSDLRPGDEVNLERAMTLAQRLGGHLVRGVVEAAGTLESLTPDNDAIVARYKAPPDILRYTIVKGPVTIDGASLTVVGKTADTLSVSLVQYTQEHTNLTRRNPGDRVNLESDIIGRYVGQLLEERLQSNETA
ncbi:MAG: riboflavin synthase [Chloroflexi bacterium]|nr:riboflavin synthase [Chloroflexota bacterium]MCI0850267.1 riboflavin synthase [Chloroflexota bacterium]